MDKISFINVSKQYADDNLALNNVSFSVADNEFVAITGFSGAGKTTILKLILGEEYPTRGEVLIDGIDIETMTKEELVLLRRNIGVVFQNFRLLSKKTVYENISFVMEVIGMTDEDIEEDVSYVLNLVNLSHKAWCFPRELSGGEQQRVAIARAIVTRPEIIIADEPTGNLDPVNTYEVIDILNQIHKLGHTVLLTSHDKDVLRKVKARMVSLDEGEIISGKETAKSKPKKTTKKSASAKKAKEC